MRTQSEVQEFEALNYGEMVLACEVCEGNELKCECRDKYQLTVAAYEACIPRDFWFIKANAITYNAEVFKDMVIPYCRQIKVARARGYGLAIFGDNGVGKTTFINYVLMTAIRQQLTTYYTTMPQLDWDIKSGFNDKEAARRLVWMLSSDFLAIDEMGKEKFKQGDTYIRTQIERILKGRFDNSMPTLIATNADIQGLEEIYGTTLISILMGKYRIVAMEPGDYREQLGKQMASEMGYE